MGNPFKHTEPDFSRAEEFLLSPDSEPYLLRIWRVRKDGDHEEDLLQSQKLLYLYRRLGGQEVCTNALCKVARAWESLDRNDISAAYLEEAFNQVKELQRHQGSKVALIGELQRIYESLGITEKMDALKPDRLYKVLTPQDWELFKNLGFYKQSDGSVNLTTLFKVSEVVKPYSKSEPILIVCQLKSSNLGDSLIHNVSEETGETFRIERALNLSEISLCSELELDHEGTQYALRRTKAGHPVVIYGTP